MATDRQYTGQRREIGLGLYDYNARYYDPTLGRFLSADTIVPSPVNPQSLNRYSYVLNNPLKYIDPSGHVEEDEVSDADQIVNELQDYGIDINPDWGWTDVTDEYGVILYRYWNPGSWKLTHLRSLNQTAKYANKLFNQYQAGEINSLTFLQKLIDYRSELGVPETFVDDISSIILGERGFGGVTRPPLHQNRWKPIALDDSGFRAYFQDSSNQVRHFWYYVHVAYTTNSGLITDIGNEGHECNAIPFRWVNGGNGTNLDRVLGFRGRDLGLALRRGSIMPIEVYGWLKRNLGAHP